MTETDRRKWLWPVLGFVLAVGGILIVALAYAAHADGYLVLRPFTAPLLPLVLAPVVLAVSAGFLVGHRMVRVCLQWMLGLVAMVGVFYAAVEAVVTADDPVEHSVVAASDEFRLMVYYWPDGYELVVRLQSRQGLASREGAQNVACFMLPRPGGEGAKWYLDRAEFTAGNGILLRAMDGQEWLITFDPSDLSVDYTVDRVPYGSSRSNCLMGLAGW